MCLRIAVFGVRTSAGANDGGINMAGWMGDIRYRHHHGGGGGTTDATSRPPGHATSGILARPIDTDRCVVRSPGGGDTSAAPPGERTTPRWTCNRFRSRCVPCNRISGSIDHPGPCLRQSMEEGIAMSVSLCLGLSESLSVRPRAYLRNYSPILDNFSAC